ncbi:hypothetical protein ACMFMG_007858 [Clarireedia jacksonii]
MEAPTFTNRLKVAISGGGLAGATLATEFSERGAAVGISVNGQRALAEIGTEVRDALDKAGAVKMNSSRLMIATGETAGSLLYDLTGAEPTLVVHRAAFLQELLKPIPGDSMHANKKLVKIQDAPEGESCLQLTFGDGSIERADVLIGADGIHGFVRKYVLGDEHPATDAKFAGFWDCCSLVPFEKAKERLGEEYFKEDRQYVWIGDGAMLMHDVLDNGQTVQCVAAIYSDTNRGFENSNSWKTPIDRKKLEEALATWKNCPITQAMMDLLLENPEPLAFAEYHHLDAPTYVKGHVCLMGDAAHAMTPWQGSGAGMAFEDAMVLQTLLANVQDASQLRAALQAYDTTRRPRT